LPDGTLCPPSIERAKNVNREPIGAETDDILLAGKQDMRATLGFATISDIAIKDGFGV
jgi:hypothetical protein